MLRRLVIATAACIGVALCLIATPAGAQYQPTQSQVLSSTTASPGDTITVSGTGCPSGSDVVTSFDDTQVGSTTANESGAFSVDIALPAEASPGTHTITSRCGSVVLSSTITILGDDGDDGGAGPGTGVTGTSNGGVSNGALPRTGFQTERLLQAGVVLTAAGGAILALSRSRRVRTA